jgi:hypothetical protein
VETNHRLYIEMKFSVQATARPQPTVDGDRWTIATQTATRDAHQHPVDTHLTLNNSVHSDLMNTSLINVPIPPFGHQTQESSKEANMHNMFIKFFSVQTCEI